VAIPQVIRPTYGVVEKAVLTHIILAEIIKRPIFIVIGNV
jgi:hypothetical protein